MFPFSISGRVRLETSRDDPQVLATLRGALDSADASWTGERDAAVVFRNRLARGRNSAGPLSAYRRGRIQIVRRGDGAWLEYRNSASWLLLVVAVVATGFFAAGLTTILAPLAEVLGGAFGLAILVCVGAALIHARRFETWLERFAARL